MIVKALERAYSVMEERGWDKVYWAIDLHGVCFESTYAQGGYSFVNEDAKIGLQTISAQPESVIILWSSCHPEEHPEIIDFFAQHDIRVAYFNENPEVPNTPTGNFLSKFYFSILLDDKAGFDPETDWWHVNRFLRARSQR